MKTMRTIIALCVMGLFFSCNNRNNQRNLQPENDPEQEIRNAIHNGSDGIVMELSPRTYPVGTDKIVLKITNRTDETIQFGANYSMERQDEDTRQWQSIPLDNVAVIAIMYMLPPGETQTYDISLFREDMDYVPGTYRIRKQFFVEEKSEDIYAEFILE